MFFLFFFLGTLFSSRSVPLIASISGTPYISLFCGSLSLKNQFHSTPKRFFPKPWARASVRVRIGVGVGVRVNYGCTVKQHRSLLPMCGSFFIVVDVVVLGERSSRFGECPTSPYTTPLGAAAVTSTLSPDQSHGRSTTSGSILCDR